jgi:hypothetical protein
VDEEPVRQWQLDDGCLSREISQTLKPGLIVAKRQRRRCEKGAHSGALAIVVAFMRSKALSALLLLSLWVLPGSVLAEESSVAVHRNRLAQMLATKPKLVTLDSAGLRQVADQMMVFSTRLPTQFFDGAKLRQDVRQKSLAFARARFDELGMPDLKILDMLYVGSLASYEYDDLSDVDIHIIIDPASFKGDPKMLRRYLSKVNDLNEFLYNRVTFYGRKADFSFYADTVEGRIEPGVGIYSLFNETWPSQPEAAPIRFSRTRVYAEFGDFVQRYNALATDYARDKRSFVCQRFSDLREEVRLYRRKGIAKDGIRSTENIVYRALRRINGNLLRQMEGLELECENIQGSL